MPLVSYVSTSKLFCASLSLTYKMKIILCRAVLRIINNVHKEAYNGYKVKITVLKL